MTNQEREEFELVAKACGYGVFMTHANGKQTVGMHTGMRDWNPKTDDGDALRLAVKLGLTVQVFIVQESRTTFTGQSMTSCLVIEIEEPHGNDPEAATRLAIWRAAVEYARSLKN